MVKTMSMKSHFFVRSRRKNKGAERQYGKSELAAPRHLVKLFRRFGIGLHHIHHPDTFFMYISNQRKYQVHNSL